MSGTRSVYFDPEAAAIVAAFQRESFHKFSPAVTTIIKLYNRQKKDILQMRKDLDELKAQLIKKEE